MGTKMYVVQIKECSLVLLLVLLLGLLLVLVLVLLLVLLVLLVLDVLVVLVVFVLVLVLRPLLLLALRALQSAAGTDLRVRHAAAEPGLRVGLVLAVAVAASRTAAH